LEDEKVNTCAVNREGISGAEKHIYNRKGKNLYLQEAQRRGFNEANFFDFMYTYFPSGV
jgi:hypothetical protein